VRLAVRNAEHSACASGEDLAAALAAGREACASDDARAALGAAWSPFDATWAGADAKKGLAALVDADVPIHYVAVRDGHAEGDEQVDVVPGDGAVGWSDQIERLAAVGFDGPLALEVRGRPAGAFGLRAATALIDMARAASRSARACPGLDTGAGS
jgi:sugar phosphate isomerase/epimerase